MAQAACRRGVFSVVHKRDNFSETIPCLIIKTKCLTGQKGIRCFYPGAAEPVRFAQSFIQPLSTHKQNKNQPLTSAHFMTKINASGGCSTTRSQTGGGIYSVSSNAALKDCNHKYCIALLVGRRIIHPLSALLVDRRIIHPMPVTSAPWRT